VAARRIVAGSEYLAPSLGELGEQLERAVDAGLDFRVVARQRRG